MRSTKTKEGKQTMKTRTNDVIENRKFIDIEIETNAQVVVCDSDEEVLTFADDIASYKHDCANVKNTVIYGNLRLESGGDGIGFKTDARPIAIMADGTKVQARLLSGYLYFMPTGDLTNIKVVAQFLDNMVIYTANAE